MSIDRRELLKAGFALPAVAVLSSAARADWLLTRSRALGAAFKL